MNPFPIFKMLMASCMLIYLSLGDALHFINEMYNRSFIFQHTHVGNQDLTIQNHIESTQIMEGVK